MCQNFKANLETILTDALDSVTSVIKIVLPDWTGLAQFEADATAAEQLVANWQSGTPGADVIEALDDLIADLNLFNGLIPPMYQAVIVVALDGIKSIIVLVDEHVGTNTPAEQATGAAAAKVMARTTAAEVGTGNAAHAKAAWTPPTVQYVGGRQFALALNKAIASRPNLVTAKMPVPKKWGILP